MNPTRSVDGKSRRKFNIFLTIFLWLVVLANTVSAGLFLLNIFGLVERSAFLPFNMVVFSALICVGNVICAIATWFWRRWGVIGYVALTVLAYVGTAISTGEYTNLFGLVGSTILVILIIPYWKYMK